MSGIYPGAGSDGSFLQFKEIKEWDLVDSTRVRDSTSLFRLERKLSTKFGARCTGIDRENKVMSFVTGDGVVINYYYNTDFESFEDKKEYDTAFLRGYLPQRDLSMPKVIVDCCTFVKTEFAENLGDRFSYLHTKAKQVDENDNITTYDVCWCDFQWPNS